MKTQRIEPTRVRQLGTKVTLSTTPEERMAAIRAIVTTQTYAKVDGIMVDLFTAAYIAQLYDALSDTSKAKYAAMSVTKMASVAFKLAKVPS